MSKGAQVAHEDMPHRAGLLPSPPRSKYNFVILIESRKAESSISREQKKKMMDYIDFVVYHRDKRMMKQEHIDKLWHLCAFSIFSLLAAYASRNWRQYYGLLVIGFALGIVIELTQANFTQHRLGEWQDQLANCLGLLWVYILAQSNKLPKLVFKANP